MVFSDSDVYKWLEALAWETQRQPSPELERLAAETTELVAAAQQPDGYLNSYWQLEGRERWSDLEMGHELYCAGHLIQAGVAAARDGRAALLGVARALSPICSCGLRADADPGTDGHPEIEMALVELYRETGERRYLDLADKLVGRRGHGPFAGGRSSSATTRTASPCASSRSIVGHAVRALYLAAGVTDLYAETGDERAARGDARASGTTWSRRSSTSPAASARATTTRRSAIRTSCRPTAPTARPARRSRASCGTGGCCS